MLLGGEEGDRKEMSGRVGVERGCFQAVRAFPFRPSDIAWVDVSRFFSNLPL